ncbi:S8 family serine peptidase [Elizabethkingia meningoseptica]|uniref:Peptidase S8 n=1 Tax=Elizabethkingia meningoseptica TaxID=238 RepID=A0A1V3U2E0_ELIME|nr:MULTISPECIES: S8 family serine peptidase [Elizabethkingia]AQX13820.1 peptidase S8 [Elizabethkingia meningoseptica]MBG0515622.1 S8 family serine peptidase [Elizabethkingia meningoseptica]MDE5436864.1 S8 family serine peptidase [Elizabethkingia meningoseptica]MDE5449382.1 S8 family serine peptidase [Elizabethkingia meningoseptica]MDE5470287.1 S8 family serine peptidase [Elizabethkingia meningoseptica]
MRKFFISAAFLTAFTFGFSQQTAEKHDKDSETWYHKDFATTKVYGINTEKAYKFLESKGLKPQTVIVGVLDSGVEVDHPGLVKNMWVNTKEIPGNGIDDDGNGYIDDIHGWNFQGGKNGDVDVDTQEVTRVVKKYKPLFEGADSAANKANQAKMPAEFDLYMKSKDLYTSKSIEAQQNFIGYSELKKRIPAIVGILGGKALTAENVKSIVPKTNFEGYFVEILTSMVKDDELAGKSGKDLEKAFTDQVDEGIKHYQTQATKQFNFDYDPRSIVGDNYDDVNERNYGNNHYEGPDAEHGTHVSGIIAGLPNGNEVQYGVASRVAKIMTVRAVPDGDERDKDVANAIRYAVDNGAKVLNMSFGKPVSPNKEKVWEAFKYAQDKGVLLVKAAGNEEEDISEHVAYPTNFKTPADEKPFLNNMIVVGASTNDSAKLRASFSNYNQKMVDIFAPGEKIYSTVPDGKYKYLQGTSMASPVVAGAAAVLLAYMPTLTPAQIIEAIVKTANKSTVDADVKGRSVNNTFNYMSRSGGVMDLYKAAEYAYNNFYSSGKKLPVKSKTKVKK